MLISIDTETSGLDLFHDACPYLVTATIEENDGRVRTIQWEWQVDPLTRKVYTNSSDLDEVRSWIFSAEDTLILHNAKFDVTALAKIMGPFQWPWHRTHDTLIAGHLLASNQPHDLTSMTLHYLARDIEPYEKRLHEVAEECRRLCRTNLPDWKIARAQMEGNPGMKGSVWKADGWLPRAVCLYAREQYQEQPVVPVLLTKGGQPKKHQPKQPWWQQKQLKEPDHPWNTVLSEYANADSTATLFLWKELERLLKERGLWAIYKERMKLPAIAMGMESRGVTEDHQRLEEIESEYTQEVQKMEQTCHSISMCEYRHELKLPKGGGCNDNLRDLLLNKMRLPVVRSSKKTGGPSLDAVALEEYEEKLRAGTLRLNGMDPTWPLLFIKTLRSMRKRAKALTDISAYKRFWKYVIDNVYRIHPNLNITGTDTLRWSSSNPNSQNISAQGMPCPACGGPGCDTCNDEGIDPRSLRYAFGPAPGREWWSIDAKNLELRIPAYKSGEKEMIDLFERPDDPPYYGSNHLLNFSAVYPDMWARELKVVGFDKVGPHCKKKYKETWYKRAKAGGFAKQYGGQKRKVDQTFGVSGAYELMAVRFSKQERLNQDAIREANKKGYVETFPDASVDPHRGYPIMVSRSDRGGVVPTKPLNYKVQSTAMWWTARAMVRVEEKLQGWRHNGSWDGFMTLQVHDEIVLDFPQMGNPQADFAYEQEHGKLPLIRISNLWRIRTIQKLMEQGGTDLGIPTPTGVEYHPVHWAEGVTM